jgi:hypothetical protein
MRKIAIISLLAIVSFYGYGQEIKSPDEFLGYELGSQFTFHSKTIDYFRYVAEVSPDVVIEEYGYSNEGRPLIACFISSGENIKDLEKFRLNNLKSIGLMDGEADNNRKPFIWLSYNVHGNESVGMETSMKVLYDLVSRKVEESDKWLEECIIVIDPCQNPDGRDLYTNRYRSRQPLHLNPDPNDWSHDQPWPSARLNHYLFDLNRDWAWQTQAETKQRIALYNRFMPQVHADFHEMGSESSYFFPPGAEPWHRVISKWQREFHMLAGEANAKLFDEKARLYFTKESFDLFCPSFGDTWPLFNGAMGFTYEQGGGGGAGLGVIRSAGDTLTLKKRIEGHYMSSLATIKASYEVRDKLIDEFVKFFRSGALAPGFEYKSVIIKGDNNNHDLKSFCDLLDANQIKYSYAKPGLKDVEGFDYFANKEGKTIIEEGDILVSAYQPQSHLVEVFFEPDSRFTDSLSYDLTGWALPYLYNLEAYAIKGRIAESDKRVDFAFENINVPDSPPYAYLADWEGYGELRLMSELYKKKLNIRYAAKTFTINGKEYKRGSLIIARGDNKHLGDKFDKLVTDAANSTQVSINAVYTGFVDKGIDLGSNNARLNDPPKIALVGGDGTSTGSFGELWFFFERELEYPVTIIDAPGLRSAKLDEYDIVYLPSGSYSAAKDKLLDYAKNGGKIVAFERAVSLFSGEKTTDLYKAVEKQKKERETKEGEKKSDDPSLLKKFENQRRESLNSRSASSIYRVKLDNTHPYVYGLGSEWFIIKSSDGLPYLENGSNIAYITENEPVSGFAGSKFIEKIGNTLVIGSERIGRGEVIYISDDPYYRAFWKSGRLILGNIAFR